MLDRSFNKVDGERFDSVWQERQLWVTLPEEISDVHIFYQGGISQKKIFFKTVANAGSLLTHG